MTIHTDINNSTLLTKRQNSSFRPSNCTFIAYYDWQFKKDNFCESTGNSSVTTTTTASYIEYDNFSAGLPLRQVCFSFHCSLVTRSPNKLVQDKEQHTHKRQGNYPVFLKKPLFPLCDYTLNYKHPLLQMHIPFLQCINMTIISSFFRIFCF